MRVLLIEDEAEMVELLEDELGRGMGAEVLVAASRSSAVGAITRDAHFDVAVCDLRIPANDGELDTSVAHGEAVVAHLTDTLPGTPLIVFSAYGDVDVMANLMKRVASGDPFGSGEDRRLIAFYKKDSLPEFIAELDSMRQELALLSGIEISTGMARVALSDQERRALHLCGRQVGGTVVHVAPLTGGLSGIRTVRLRIDNDRGAPVLEGVAKLGPLNALEDERQRCENFVMGRLAATTFAPVARFIRSGAGAHGALVYSLAGGFESSLFEAIASQPHSIGDLVERLRQNLSPWRQDAPAETVGVVDIRQALVSDDELLEIAEEIGHLPVGEVDGQQLQVRACPQHGDLHGGNVLVASQGSPVLIDYGRTGLATASLDPVALEFSLLFHPDAQGVRGDWPHDGQAARWDDLDIYLQGCPAEDFVRGCRRWAFEVAGGDREVWANVFAFAIRQLKYPDTDKGLARAVATRAAELLLG